MKFNLPVAEPAPDSEDLLICEHCDAVYRRRPLARGEVLQCRRCDAVLERHQWLGPDAILALVMTAMIAFAISTAWPVLGLAIHGEEISATLWDSILLIWREHYPLVGVLVAVTLFFAPMLRMLLMAWVLLPAGNGRHPPGFAWAMVALHYLRPWTMSEVFVLGIFVTIAKARFYFDVTFYPGFFGYASLMLLVMLLSGVDLRWLWAHAAEHAS